MTDRTYDASVPAAGGIGLFERWLSAWVALCILAGIVLGNLLPGLFGALASIEFASVNLVVAVLIWAMVFPMMVNVDFASLRHVGDRPKGLVLTIVVNWLIKPFTMAALGVLFFKYVFARWIDPADAQQYIAGLILLGAAPCTAMVFVWSQMTRGDPNYTLVQVSVNDVIMIFAFAPIVALLLGVTDIAVPWETLLLSVALYVVIPLVAGALTRKRLLDRAGGGPGAGGRGGGFRIHGRTETGFRDRTAGNGRAPVRIPGKRHNRKPAADRPDRGAAPDPVLRDLLHRLWRSESLEGPLQRRRTLRADRHFQFLRTRRCGGHQPVWPELGRRARNRRRRARRSPRHAVAGRLRKPHAALVPRGMSAMTITIYHNPACGTSRNTLAMIRQSGEEPHVIEYLKTPPSRGRLVELIAAMGISPRQLLREKGTPYGEIGLADRKWTDDEIVDFMVEHPILINRPIVETPLGTKLCRPSEEVLPILPNPVGRFVKEDGEAVTDPGNAKS